MLVPSSDRPTIARTRLLSESGASRAPRLVAQKERSLSALRRPPDHGVWRPPPSPCNVPRQHGTAGSYHLVREGSLTPKRHRGQTAPSGVSIDTLGGSSAVQ